MTGEGTGLSVAIITLNEEANVGPCLESVKWADEVVVCDSGSQDRTLEIAAGYGARIFQDEWLGFAAHKNLAVSRCSQPWILVLDADERVPPPLRDEIQGILRSEDAADGYSVGRRNFFLGAWIRHGGWSPDQSIRLFRRARGRFLPRTVHEVVEVSGRTGTLQHPLEHYTYASISDFLRRMDRYAALAAGELLASGHRCRVVDLTLRPAWTFLRMYLLRRGFLDGWRGLLLAGLYASYTFAKYAQLWERQRAPAAG